MKVVLMLWALAFSFSTCNVSAAGVLSDQEIERQLKILNKPWIKTFQIDDGSVIDYVDIDKQPALHNPLLKNHKIQIMPSSCPPVPDSKLAFSGYNGTNEIKELPYRNSTHNVPDNKGRFWVDLAMEPKYRMFAIGADIQIQNLTLAQDQSSTASILIFDGITPNPNVIAAGGKVSPALYGDSHTRLFTF
ncbi:hypothetical protein TIFTF001_002883 [Ficus carica]|uniref:Neprosin PEP catalytic domain-containing protein n=1 Tax=Ficus carica TaxID=3494 RepID=A0AA87ZPX4_FICCA|nr:hypothetical protein TIFTF001_002883 [Ficus carica]